MAAARVSARFRHFNLDLAVTKDIAIREGIGATLSFQFINVLNHFQPANPSPEYRQPRKLRRGHGSANTPRQMEFGLRIFF